MRTLGIKHTDVNEVQVPKQLQQGYISLGTVKCKGNTQDSFIEDKYNTGNLPLLTMGAQGDGTDIKIYKVLNNNMREIAAGKST
ncbi:hypothetical protein [Clostridium tagluense]|uniref:hypothetical protein n=1 Tax=Clostridium tagluense TaxID=360422 RepID=UPI001CF3A82B|nr:hypothetical protein [Clostridium tagluense]MCB2300112.1 hypothetical protein [Clostridium tagluense]